MRGYLNVGLKKELGREERKQRTFGVGGKGSGKRKVQLSVFWLGKPRLFCLTTVWRSGVVRKLEAKQKLEGMDFERVWWISENISPLASKHLVILGICGLALVTPRIGHPFLSWLGLLSGVLEHGTCFPEVGMLKMRSYYSDVFSHHSGPTYSL